MFDVPILNGTLPAPTETAYLAYKNVNFHTLTRDVSRGFVPIVQIGQAPNSQWVKAPKVSTADNLNLNFGHSLLFLKSSPAITTLPIKIVVTCDV